MSSLTLSALPPEILNIICSLANISDCARLGQTSQSLLHLAIPYVWESIQLEDILILLPGFCAIESTTSMSFQVSD